MPEQPASKPGPPSPRRAAAVLTKLAALYPDHPLEVKGAEPFRVLVATMLSARTQDPTTNAAMRRLWQNASTPDAILQITEDDLAAILKPVGFYKTKARNLHKLCRVLIDSFGRQVPATREELMQLSGVGRKTANLILNVCFGIPAICVDTHVHRIVNRLGWVATNTPEETENTLAEIVPKKHWAALNRVLVNHGQRICNPVSPKCSQCAIAGYCEKRNVLKFR
ncbi:endonuclease III [bacterium]|nr:endonuclease III [bacterium]